MKDWIEGLQASIHYIEKHLPEELNIGEIARKLRFFLSIISESSVHFAA